MHLAIVSPFPPSITGIGQYGYHVVRTLAHSGAFTRITVLAGSEARGSTPNHLGSTEIEYCWKPGQWEARQAILSGLKRLSPDLVWFNLGASVFGKSPWMNISGLLTPMLARQMGFPTVVTLHELVESTDLRALDAPGGILAPLGARLLTRIAAQADVMCLTMNQYVDRLSTRGVECAHIPIGAYHQPELLPGSTAHELLFFTTLAPFKGLELLLEAFPVLRLRYPDLKLTIAGAGHARFPKYALELKSRFADMQGVEWLGQVVEDDVIELFRRARVVVLPYTASTGSSSVLYQAATWGRAIVASDLDEIRNLAKESGLQVNFFKRGDADSLRNSIQTLLDSPEEHHRQVAHNLFSMRVAAPDETGRKYIHAFNRALEIRRAPGRIEFHGGPTS